MELNMQYMDPMGIPISNDLLSISETTVAPLKTWWFYWKSVEKNYVRFGEAYFHGRDLRFREGSPLFSACLGGVDTSYFGKAQDLFLVRAEQEFCILHPDDMLHVTANRQGQ